MPAKERTPYNDLELWREYCARLQWHGWPKSERDAMRVIMPDMLRQADQMSAGLPTWKELGIDLPEQDEAPSIQRCSPKPVCHLLGRIRYSARLEN